MNSGVVVCLRAKCTRNFKDHAHFYFDLTHFTAHCTSSANAHTSHKSRVTASVLALLVAQTIRWRYSASVGQAIYVVTFEMVWGGCRSAHGIAPLQPKTVL